MIRLKDLVTLLNLVAGFFSILLGFQGEIWWSATMIFVAYFFDAVDGSFAKLTGTSNRFGAELDSACDNFSFGIAPAFLVVAAFRPSHPWLGVGLGLWLVTCSTIRQARSNLTKASYPGYFFGLNRPVSAMIIAALINSMFFNRNGFLVPNALLIGVTGLLNLTLTPYVNHRQSYSRKRKTIVYAWFALTLIPAIALRHPWEGTLVLLGIYIFHPFFFIPKEEKVRLNAYIKDFKQTVAQQG